jgi:hypothetical protein
MDLDRGRVEREGLKPDTHDLLGLKLLEDAIQNAALGSAIHTCINVMPIAEFRRKTAPFAAMLGKIQNGIGYGKVLKFHIPGLNRQAVLDLFVLLNSNLY